MLHNTELTCSLALLYSSHQRLSFIYSSSSYVVAFSSSHSTLPRLLRTLSPARRALLSRGSLLSEAATLRVLLLLLLLLLLPEELLWREPRRRFRLRRRRREEHIQSTLDA